MIALDVLVAERSCHKSPLVPVIEHETVLLVDHETATVELLCTNMGLTFQLTSTGGGGGGGGGGGWI